MVGIVEGQGDVRVRGAHVPVDVGAMTGSAMRKVISVPKAESPEVLTDLVRGLLSGQRWGREKCVEVGEVAGWEDLAGDVGDRGGGTKKYDNGASDSQIHGG